MLRRDEVPFLAVEDTAYEALAAVGESAAAHALVVSAGRLVGLLSITDLERALEAAPHDGTS
jgi:CBS domain-containing protein